MTTEFDAKPLVGSAIAPVVLISACALILLSFNNRMVSILTRLRALHRELAGTSDKQWARVLRHELQSLRKGACFVRFAVMQVLLAITSMLCCCFVMGVGTMYPKEAAAPTLVLFALGILAAIGASTTMLFEAAIVAQPVELEMKYVLGASSDDLAGTVCGSGSPV